MAALVRMGARVVIEVGPGRVLSALARRCDPALQVVSLHDARSCEQFLSGRGMFAALGAVPA